MRNTFLVQGVRWTESTEAKVKNAVACCIPDVIEDIDKVVIPQKSSFLQGLATMVERMISE